MSPTEASSSALRSAVAIETFCAETLLCKSAALAKFRMAGIMVGSAITVHFPGQFSRVFLPDGYCPLGKFLLHALHVRLVSKADFGETSAFEGFRALRDVRCVSAIHTKGDVRLPQ